MVEYFALARCVFFGWIASGSFVSGSSVSGPSVSGPSVSDSFISDSFVSGSFGTHLARAKYPTHKSAPFFVRAYAFPFHKSSWVKPRGRRSVPSGGLNGLGADHPVPRMRLAGRARASHPKGWDAGKETGRCD